MVKTHFKAITTTTHHEEKKYFKANAKVTHHEKKKFQNKFHQLLLPLHEDEKKINEMTEEQKSFIVNVYFEFFYKNKDLGK